MKILCRMDKPLHPRQRIGRLVLISRTVRQDYHAVWLCHCDCGNKKTIRESQLKSGDTLSCRCLQRELARAQHLTHGMTKTPTYNIWRGMMKRCYSKTSKKYHGYGDRGIRVSRPWHSFDKFYSDMGPRPVGMSLERRNNNGNYSFKNCEWATAKKQGRNRRSNRIYFFKRKNRTLAEISEMVGISGATIQYRLKHNWSFGDAVTRTPNFHNRVTQ